MELDEAIKALEELRGYKKIGGMPQWLRGLGLGIEALKLVKRLGYNERLQNWEALPGETGEEQPAEQEGG